MGRFCLFAYTGLTGLDVGFCTT